jgi:Flp pilus assembly protein TadD
VAGEAALATGNMALASTYYEHAAGLDKGNVGTQVRLAQVRMASGETARAFSDLESISAADPSQAQADMALIAGHLRRHEYDKALAASDALIRKQPENPLTYSVRGSIYLAKRDLANARTSFDKALSLDPKNFPAAYNLAMLDVREGKPQAAKARYESMLDKEPGNEQLLIAEADLLALTGNPPADTR